MNKFSIALLLSVTSSFTSISTAIAATDAGTMTLTLSGVIDMNINPSNVQYIPGALTGTTSFSGTPVYATSSTSTWSRKFAIIALSQNYSECNSGFVSSIPGQSNKYGLKLSHTTNSNVAVYVTPALNYAVTLTNFTSPYFDNFYAGRFFQQNTGVVDSSDRGVCFSPTNITNVVPAGGNKKIDITSPGNFPVYISAGLTPGKLIYRGTPFYVGSFGTTFAADYYLQVKVIADVMVKRSCSVTGVSAQQFNENMTLADELTRNSTFTVSCGGTGNPVNISATIKEGSYESGQPTKLLLAPINGTVSDEKPWVLGMAYRQGQEPSLTCNDAGRSGLIKFDNTNVELSGINMGNNVAEIMGIKWALCKTPQVKAGDYRAKVDISIFVRG